MAGAHLLLQFIDRAGEDGVIGGAGRRRTQGRVLGRHRRLGGVEQRLVQFLAGPQADKADFDVAVGAQPGEPDHLPRQIDDLDRLAHVEDENLAARSRIGGTFFGHGLRRGGFEHKLDRLAHGHETARDIRVGHCQRPTRRELAREERHGRPPGGRGVKTGPPDPAEPSTLPKRTVTKRVPPAWTGRRASARSSAWQKLSARRLVAPMTLAGLTALSVEIITKSPTPWARAASATLRVPTTLLSTPSIGFASTLGTCFSPAA